MRIKIADIITTAGTQNRPDCDTTANLYAERMVEGDIFPLIEVAQLIKDGVPFGNYLIDGFTRIEAYKKNGIAEVDAEIVQVSTVDEAIWLSFSANKSNGRQRGSGDITGMLRRIFTEKEFSKHSAMSLREIANHIGCSHELVRKIKSQCSVASVKEELDLPDDVIADAVSGEVATAFDITGKVNGVVRLLGNVMSIIDALPESGTELMDTAYYNFVLQGVADSIKDSAPSKPCPHCDGIPDCYVCSGKGWVTKSQMKSYKEHKKE